jgi:hypothetical protein
MKHIHDDAFAAAKTLFLMLSIFVLFTSSGSMCAGDSNEGILIQTDGDTYQMGETISMTMTNNLDKPIWYLCGYDCRSPADTVDRHIEGMPEPGMGDLWYLYFPPYPAGDFSLKPLYRKLNAGVTTGLKLSFSKFWTGEIKGSFPTKYKIVVFVSFQKPGESVTLTRFYSNEIEIE